MIQKNCFAWNEADFTWIGNEYTWNDVCLVINIVEGGPDLYQNYQNLSKKDKEHFITLILKIKDQKITQKKKKQKHKITVGDIELVVKEVLKENISVHLNSHNKS